MPDSLYEALRKMLDATDPIVNSEGRNVDLDALYEARSDAREAIDYLDNPAQGCKDPAWCGLVCVCRAPAPSNPEPSHG